ncbi:putative calreticulin [Trypanosoma cruzi]|uniref:Calreticulin n=1 Tax=Trypanosoma cruzi TaxID=5693 RepID=A0A2V2WY72_TRYCR|nr:putative calreticulin [Trypanosoma cruzi]RNC58776.1 putative calreticulin [Trypanosoma cruzi]
MRAAIFFCALLSLATLSAVHGTVYFHEEFKSMEHWTTSKHRDDFGKVEISAGKFYADAEKSKGLRLTEDARFYALSTAFPTPITNEKKSLVVSFSVKHEQDLKCGGGYIKLLPSMDPEKFHGETKYWLMFGPDRCGSQNRVHIILHYNGENREWSKRIRFPEDKLTHVYTLHIAADNSYEFFLDGESKAKGQLDGDWTLLPPREIVDETDKKPEDWVDEETMDDPEDKKPEDWDNEPAMIPDADAKKPDDWDDAEDGPWEAPMIPNPKSKGTWKPRQIPNPAYKGVWEPRKIPNPDFVEDTELHKVPEPLTHVGIDVWQVESGSIFKDIMIGDDLKEVLELVEKTYGSLKKAEADALKVMEDMEKEKRKKEEEEEKEKEKAEEEKDEEELEEKGDGDKEDL